MAKIQFKNGGDYLLRLETLEGLAKQNLLGSVVYDGAAVVADIVRKEIQTLPEDNRWGTQDNPIAGPSAYQKKGLEDSFGISTLRNDNGFVNVKLGFDGYNGLKTKRWPNGQPNQMIARSVERGTSWMKANPFMKRALRKARKQALEVMDSKLQIEIQKIMKRSG